MFRTLFTVIAFTAPLSLVACDNDDAEIDICSDDLDCDDGLICEITGEDDGLCINDE